MRLWKHGKSAVLLLQNHSQKYTQVKNVYILLCKQTYWPMRACIVALSVILLKKLTVVSGFSSFLEVLLIDSGITSIVPVHPTSRRSKAYSKASDSCSVPKMQKQKS